MATTELKCGQVEVKNSNWLIDSGCTNHMTADMRMFNTLDSSYESRVKMANGQYINVESRGDVDIETIAGMRTFDKVLYVLEIKQNLVSVGQLLEDGYSLSFINGICTNSSTEVEPNSSRDTNAS